VPFVVVARVRICMVLPLEPMLTVGVGQTSQHFEMTCSTTEVYPPQSRCGQWNLSYIAAAQR
jgi:hypothetical protein